MTFDDNTCRVFDNALFINLLTFSNFCSPKFNFNPVDKYVRKEKLNTCLRINNYSPYFPEAYLRELLDYMMPKTFKFFKFWNQ